MSAAYDFPRPIYVHGEIAESDLPDAVQYSIRKWAEARRMPRSEVVKALRDDTMNRCYCFTWRGCYYGVEYADGHIHT